MSDERIKSFRVPDLGEGLEEVTVTQWHVALGDDVELNQVLCTVETAKAEVEIPSPYAGRIVERNGAEGDVLNVGTVLLQFDTAPLNGELPAAETAVPTLVGYGADSGIDTSRRTTRPLAAPPVRKLAKELSVDLGSVPHDAGAIITRADVLSAARGNGDGADVRPVLGVQSRMAEKMTLSHKEIPAAKVGVEVDCSELLRLSDRLRAQDETITPFVLMLRLLVIALRRNEILNSTWVDSPQGPQVRVDHRVHLGIATATERGLLVPVIADAHRKTTRELASRAAELIAGARGGGLGPGELRGSTFTVTNFGALGADDGVPIINHPEAAILGIGAIKPRPVVRGADIVVRPTMSLTCVFDHRIADGAQAAQFVCELKDLIESPETALLDL
ncbi:dihydrolipoamide acetyltransferase family protein [Mycobacterium sp. 852002-40037_SCH5390672]|uniref:dihydrolipoamide acetyltransferase family protein n=1 Tax=Mycobacterium sp. 852002-40037_SCH5390672 TaxID=1834089 RepID=UPI0008060084|nr:dihydrolipoamide acetyltransferase family protein [Mycobacterium sp. 852002-40037_SCH5390672]OBB99120.1 branched-chain alpha-keto acid dehydrogenase subunit E2 [Mycobacterium sp. 852002-40037_SCH5390672]